MSSSPSAHPFQNTLDREPLCAAQADERVSSRSRSFCAFFPRGA